MDATNSLSLGRLPIRLPAASSLVWLLSFVSFLATVYAYWPGVIRIDSVLQYTQAVEGRYSDWHPPIMAWLWSRFNLLWQGTQSMLLLQASLYWAGISLVAGALASVRRNKSAFAALAIGWSPVLIGYVGIIFKDVGVTAAFVAATGIIAHFRIRRRSVPVPAFAAAMVLIAYGALLRFNSLFAAFPLLVYAVPSITGWGSKHRVIAGLAACATLLAAAPAINYGLLKAERDRPSLSAIIYDLGGITYFTSDDQFKPLALDNLVKINQKVCYSDFSWDIYFIFECSVVYEKFRRYTADSRLNPVQWWIGSIVKHPAAYLKHRIVHFNSNTRFLLPHGYRDVTYLGSSPNPYGFAFQPNGLTRHIQTAGLFVASTPFGWPITWITIAIGWIVLAPAFQRSTTRALMLAFAASALAYAGSYFVMSVASDMRYHHWTILSATLASVIGISELSRATSVSRVRIWVAASPVLLVMFLGMMSRVFDFSLLNLLQ